MISEAAYRELEYAVEPENVSREPAVLDGYARQTLLNEDPSMWIPRPVAVVLPASTEEVQAVVRACNKHGLKFKAFSTGWGVHCGPTGDGVIQIDLRRMDHILEIDDRNMYAMIEPYVCGGQLQAEAMKVGLNTHLVGAGPACSLLASSTSMQGMSMDAISMGHSSRNVLGVEWVLPDGNVLRLGTPGSGLGWFSGDGPGPSLRGIMRGPNGAMGGLGVFTKCAVKLFKWPGPSVVETDGTVLDARSSPVEGLPMFMCLFPDKKSMVDATYALGDAEIGYHNVRISPAAYFFLLCPRLFRKILQAESIKGLVSEALKYGMTYLLASDSDQEMGYQVEVLRTVVSDHRGIVIDLSSASAIGSFMLMNFVRHTFIPLVFRYSGLFTSHIGGDDAWDAQLDLSQALERVKKKWIDAGTMLDDTYSCPFMVQYENNMWSHCEEVFLYDHRDRDFMGRFGDINLDFTLSIAEHCMEPLNAIVTPPIRRLLSPLMGNFSRLQEKISGFLDPEGSADSTLYKAEADIDLSEIDQEQRRRIKELIDKKAWADSVPPGWLEDIERTT
jgi:glycolate oxidase